MQNEARPTNKHQETRKTLVRHQQQQRKKHTNKQIDEKRMRVENMRAWNSGNSRLKNKIQVYKFKGDESKESIKKQASTSSLCVPSYFFLFQSRVKTWNEQSKKMPVCVRAMCVFSFSLSLEAYLSEWKKIEKCGVCMICAWAENSSLMIQ